MWVDKQVSMMGTTIDLSICHKKSNDILKETVKLLEQYEREFSANDDSSALMTLNKQAGTKPIKVNSRLFELIQIGKKHSEEKNSYLNIAIGPLTKAWHIGFKDAQVPSESDISFLLAKINPRKIKISEDTQEVFIEKEMEIDLGALAKGYIADLIIEYWKQQSVSSGLINLGGNIVTFGEPKNTNRNKWHIGVRNPLGNREDLNLILKIKNKSIVTSGIYERTFKKNEKMYHHIFDSKTGYPVETDILSITIISDKSIDGEIWTSKLFGQTSEKAISSINSNPSLEGIVITESKTLYSNGLNEFL